MLESLPAIYLMRRVNPDFERLRFFHFHEQWTHFIWFSCVW